MKIWTCRNAWTRIKNVNGASRLSNFFFLRDPNDFLSRLVTMDEIWLYNYGPETKQQSIPIAKIRWKSSCLNFLGSRRHPPHWLSSKGPNYKRGVLIIFAGAIERHSEGKTPREAHQGGLVRARQCPGSPGTCNPEETGLRGLPSVLITHPMVRIWPRRTATCSLDWKKTIERSPFFVRRGGHSCRGDLVGRTTF